MSKTRLGVVAAVAAGLLLSGCGSASPGVAVQVGDQDISTNRVDELAGEYCRALEDQLKGNSQVVPQRYFRGGIAGTLAMRSVAEQLAEQYDVEPGPDFRKKVAELEQSVGVLEEDVQEAVVTVETSPSYVEAVQRAIGQTLLAREGGEQTYDAQVARGKQEFDAWIAEHEVRFDPSLGIELVDGEIASAETALSVPVSDEAVSGAEEQPDQTYARTLPSAHTCG